MCRGRGANRSTDELGKPDACFALRLFFFSLDGDFDVEQLNDR